MDVTIIGAGMGAISLLTTEAITSLKNSDLVIATDRIYEQIQIINPNTKKVEFNNFVSYIEKTKNIKKIAIAVSGDVFFYSVATNLVKQLECLDEVNVSLINGVNCLQYFCTKIKKSYDDVVTLSVHGRDDKRQTDIIPYVCYNQKVFVLTGGLQTGQTILNCLAEAGLGHIQFYSGEYLSLDKERILEGRVKDFLDYTFESLCVMFFYNPNYVNCYLPLRDEHFIRGKVPMSKYSVRVLSIQSLEINPTDIVYDIGAGTGAISIECARKANKGIVYAIEHNKNACELIEKNRHELGAYNVSIINGMAPDVLSNLPKPSCAFIGGSSGNLKSIVEVLINKNPLVRICINAITLETLADGKTILETIGCKYDILCIQASHSEKIASYHMMKAENPVYIMFTIREREREREKV